MQSKIVIPLLCALVGCVVAGARIIDADTGIMQFMIGTRDLQKNNPARSVDCFDYYTPIINENYKIYESEYRACVRAADEDKLTIDERYTPLKRQIDSNATSTCDTLASCKALNSSRSAFQCYSIAGSNNSLVLYDISANASEALAELVEHYRLIEFNEARCTNATEIRYVQITADTYEALHNCLLGLDPVPSSTNLAPETAEAQALPGMTSVDLKSEQHMKNEPRCKLRNNIAETLNNIMNQHKPRAN